MIKSSNFILMRANYVLKIYYGIQFQTPFLSPLCLRTFDIFPIWLQYKILVTVLLATTRQPFDMLIEALIGMPYYQILDWSYINFPFQDFLKNSCTILFIEWVFFSSLCLHFFMFVSYITKKNCDSISCRKKSTLNM